jgi:uncharacterized protein (DUF302 family)
MITVFSHPTEVSFEEAFTRLSTSLQEYKFGVLCAIPLSEKFKEKGIAFDEKMTICEVCNPFEANKIMGINEQAMFFLPCKIIIRTVNQKTFLEMANPTSLVAPFNDPELTKLAKTIEDTLIKAIQQV